MRTVETAFPDQEEVELEILQAFPTFFVCADGTLVEPDGTLIANPDAGEILYGCMELLPKGPTAEEESEEEFAEAFGVEAASRFDAALEWIDPLAGKMPYGVGKRVPTYSNPYYDGGMVAYWSYFEGFHQPFNVHAVRRGDLLLRRYRNRHTDQGHVAVSLGDGADALLLQSYWSHGDGLPGLNKLIIVSTSHAVVHYERIVRVNNWINYRGDEF